MPLRDFFSKCTAQSKAKGIFFRIFLENLEINVLELRKMKNNKSATAVAAGLKKKKKKKN